MVDYEIFRFFSDFFIELSCVYFDTYKRSPKEFYFILVPYMSALTRMNVLKKPQLSYVIEKRKRGFLRFCPPAEKAFISRRIS